MLRAPVCVWQEGSLTEAPGKSQRAFLRAEQAILGHDQPAALTTSGPSVAKQHLDHPKVTSTEQAKPIRIAMAKVTATASPAKTSRIARTAASIQRLAVRQQVLVMGPAHTFTLPEEGGAGYNAGNSHNGHAPGFMVSASPTSKHTRARSLYPACSQFVHARFCGGSCCAMGLLNRTCFQDIQTCFSVAWTCRRRAVAEGLQPRCLHASLGILITQKFRKKMDCDTCTIVSQSDFSDIALVCPKKSKKEVGYLGVWLDPCVALWHRR